MEKTETTGRGSAGFVGCHVPFSSLILSLRLRACCNSDQGFASLFLLHEFSAIGFRISLCV
jgi:hypothetical protein